MSPAAELLPKDDHERRWRPHLPALCWGHGYHWPAAQALQMRLWGFFPSLPTTLLSTPPSIHLPFASHCRFVSGAGTTSLIWLRKRTLRAAAPHAALAMTKIGLSRWLPLVTGPSISNRLFSFYLINCTDMRRWPHKSLGSSVQQNETSPSCRELWFAKRHKQLLLPVYRIGNFVLMLLLMETGR